MVLTKEQLKATGASSPTDIKVTNGVTPTQDNITTNKMVDSGSENQREIYPQSQTQDQLKAKIATGNFSASEARQYNQMTGSNTGARDVALTSQQGVQNLQTTVTPEETAKIAQAGISDVGAGVKPDMEAGTKEDFKQATQNAIEKTTIQTPEGTTVTTKETPQATGITKDTNWKDVKDKTPANLEQLVEARYGTIATQNPDGSITAIIGDKKYQWTLDSALNPIKTEVQLTQAEKYKQSILNKYANAGLDTLYNAFVNGQIPSDIQGDLMLNPNFTLAKQKYDKKLSTDATNSQMENVYNTMTGKEITVVDKGQELNNKLVDLLTGMGKNETDLVSFRDYMAKNYPDLVTQTTDLNSKNKRLKELSDIANKNLRDIEAKYPGLSKGSAILLANKQNEAINDEMRTLQFDIAELSSNIQFKTNQANQDYNYMQEQQARKDALLREQRGMAFNYLQGEQQYQRGLEADQRNFEQQKEMLQLQQDYKNANIQTDIIKVGNKNVLINRKTGETIKSFDLPTATTKPEGLIKMGEDSLYDPVTQTWITKPTATSGLGDLRNLASQFPGQAWAKNNNPAGITWNANFDKGIGTAALLKEAGINFSKGTSRPASEGGNYVTFDTMEDGLKAQRIIMSQTYGNLTVGDMLKKWVGTKEGPNYAKQVAGMAGIDINTKVSDLADSELTTLQLAKIQKESPGLYGILTQPEAGPTDSGSGAPIAYARRIKSMVPATLMNSEVELAQLNNTIGELYKKGVSAEDAVLTYLGVEFNPEVKDLGINLIDKVRGLELDPSYYSSMTDLLNKGKIDQAVRKTENLAIKEAQKLNPDLKFSEGGTTFAVKQANNILDLVNQYESKFGTITGKWENLTKGFFGDKEAQELATKITQAISKTRNDLVGSNITAGEQGAIGELIPRLDESAETVKIKLNNLKNSPLLQYNQARASVGLPELDENSLLNINNRINLYKGITSTTQGGGRIKGATKGRIK